LFQITLLPFSLAVQNPPAHIAQIYPLSCEAGPDWLRQSSARYGFCRTKSILVRGVPLIPPYQPQNADITHTFLLSSSLKMS
ncbi:hypothetical protein NE664_14760, partial [Anaerotignum faecicola]|nr:hypothetical protein [Anaerotignum faecicola]